MEIYVDHLMDAVVDPMVHFGLDQALEGVDDLSFSFNFTAPISMISKGSRLSGCFLPSGFWFHSRSNTI